MCDLFTFDIFSHREWWVKEAVEVEGQGVVSFGINRGRGDLYRRSRCDWVRVGVGGEKSVFTE